MIRLLRACREVDLEESINCKKHQLAKIDFVLILGLGMVFCAVDIFFIKKNAVNITVRL